MESQSQVETDDEAVSYEVLVMPPQQSPLVHHHSLESPNSLPYPFSGTSLPRWGDAPKDLPAKHKGHLNSLSVTYDQVDKIQKETKQQANSSKWFELKKPRLTASNFGKICKKMRNKRSKPELVARDMVNPKSPTDFQNKIFNWGKDNESTAIQVYKGIAERKHVTVHECGLYISPEDPILGATPDRVCYDSTEASRWGVIEVKCPYSARTKTPTKAAQSDKFMAELHDGNVKLKHDHEYYFQVQGQMAITGAQWCDFVIYTKAGISIERIKFDPQFWKSAASDLNDFFYSYFLPRYLSS